VNRLTVDSSDWKEQNVPQVVLCGHDLVEYYKAPSLDQQAQPQVIVEQKTSCDQSTPLGKEGQDGNSGGVRRIEKLVDQVKVN